MSCNRKPNSACPFSFTDSSEMVQNYGCLPTPLEIVQMRVEQGKTWACHENPLKPCRGALEFLKEQGFPYKVIDKNLVTEKTWQILLERINP